MIRISKIDTNLTVFKDKKIVLWGIGKIGLDMINICKSYGLNVIALCDSDEKKQGLVYDGKKILSPNELKKMIVDDTENNILVQISTEFDNDIIIDELVSWGSLNHMYCGESYGVLKQMLRLEFLKKYPDLNNGILNMYQGDKIDQNRTFFDNVICKNNEMTIIKLFSTEKVGTTTIEKTISLLTNHNSFSGKHSPISNLNELLEYNKDLKIKFITGVRDPIAQNISRLFQHISLIGWLGGVWDEYFAKSDINIFENGGDAQYMFDTLLYADNKLKEKSIRTPYTWAIQDFIPYFKEYVFDLTKHPFDKEKGYTVMKEGNIEVFVYQLEKMNDMLLAFSDFIGEPITEWVKSNDSSEKWVAKPYKQAQKELKLTQEYFDSCYDNDWIRHFYTDEDIEKFKDRWRNNIK